MHKICRLKPNTKRLKQLIKQFGEEWHLIGEVRQPQCFNGENAVMVQSICKKHLRWVAYPEDIAN